MLDRNQLDQWFLGMRTETEAWYLASNDPYQQSGWDGSAENWRIGREPILDAIGYSGTFLDIGCANGLLLESLLHWTAERGITFIPYGIDLSPRLIELARLRLPTFAAHLQIANAFTWHPFMRFDYVHTLLEYVPAQLHRTYLDRVYTQMLVCGGRLLVSSYGSQNLQIPTLYIADYLSGLGYGVGGEVASQETNGWIATRTAWIVREE